MPTASSRLPASTTTLQSLNRHRTLLRPILTAAILVACASLAWADRLVGVLAYKDDAYVAYDAGLKQWSVGSRGMQVQIGFSRSGADRS